ncbi:B12-binding domain-containing radical SAM protein [bacterium]|nr:B12-binding domain-containing radical SAM protein [candidate division CSSED10-310 bacterium]
MRALLLLPHHPGVTPPPLPVGLAYIAGVLRREGVEVTALVGMPWEAMTDRLHAEIDRFDLVGMQTFATNIDQCRRLGAWIKSRHPGCVVIAGGTQASNFPEVLLADGAVDIVALGEGERTTAGILAVMRGDVEPAEVPGLAYRQDGRIQRNVVGGAIYEMDSIPFPAWDLFYTQRPIPVGHVLTFRGCPYKCANCPVRFPDGGAVREHSVRRVMEEVDILVNEYGAASLEFYDETFTLNRQRTLELCAALAGRRTPWRCYTRIGHVDEEVLRAMQLAGCQDVFFGIGTGVPRLMDILESAVPLDRAREVFTITNRLGLPATASFSIGLPTETLAESLATIRYAASLKAGRILFQPALPFPGSRLHQTASVHGTFLITDWSRVVGWDQVVYVPHGRHRRGLQLLIKAAKAAARLRAATR